MKSFYLSVLILLVNLTFLSASNLQLEDFDLQSHKSPSAVLQKAINKLLKSILKEQSKKDIEFRSFPPRFAEIKGLFKSYIHVNFAGDKNNLINQGLREQLKCLDMNMFVSNFVLIVMLEANDLKTIELPKKSFIEAFDGMIQFLDKNYPNNAPVYTFWRQKKFEKWWSQYPDTMVGLLNNRPNTDWIVKICKKLGLNAIADFLTTFNSLWEMFDYAYKIPSDLDDTFTAMALTSQLKHKNDPDFNKKWVEKNDNIEELFSIVKKLTYKPFIANEEDAANPMDPRTYFWIHDFLMYFKNKYPEKYQDLAIPTTWLWDIKTERISYEYVSIPFHGNNVDLNVVSNFFFGVTNMIIFNPDQTRINSVIDDEIRSILKNLGIMFEYVIENNIVNKRPDISVLYYPSIWDFYWMISRTSNLIKNHIENDKTYKKGESELKDLLVEINGGIKDQLKTNTMNYLVDQVKHKGKNEVFVVEFLGNYANKDRNEDALFSTGLTLNTLLNIWTKKDGDKIVWEDSITEETKKLIDNMANFVVKSSLNKRVSRQGAFFSGSVHSQYSSMPFYYPSNYFKYLNGTSFPPNVFEAYDFTSIVGVDRHIEDDEFKKQIEELHYGKNVPLKPDDIASSLFPLWSSPAMTESIALLGLSKYKVLKESTMTIEDHLKELLD